MPKDYPRPDWFLDWKDEVVVIVAGGPSADKNEYEIYKGLAKFIVVNNAWLLVPWADVLFAGDGGWWNRNKGCKEFKGLKVTVDFNASRDFHLPRVTLDRLSNGVTGPAISTKIPGQIGTGRNSGFYAINLAVQFGPPRKIILCGFDMNVKNGVHWHGLHPRGASNPSDLSMQRWAKILDGEAKTFQKLGVKVINTCLTSILKAYPKMSFEEAMKDDAVDNAITERSESA